jgi:hypothetical protein
MNEMAAKKLAEMRDTWHGLGNTEPSEKFLVSQPLVVVTERGHQHRQHDRPAPIYQTPREAKHLRNAGWASANTPTIKKPSSPP